MSLARSLTSRMRARFEDHNGGPVPSRAFSTKNATSSRVNDKNIDRRLISLPVELLSTSNAQAYEAPDIKSLIEPSQHLRSPVSPTHTLPSQSPSSPLSPLNPQSPLAVDVFSPQLSASSASSTHSWEDTLASPTSPALTSASSVTSREVSREPSPLSCDPNPMSNAFFFDTPKLDTTTDKSMSVSITEVQPDSPITESTDTLVTTAVPTVELTQAASPTAPAIPQRSATHTKEVHQTLARQRSLSRISTSPRQSVEQPVLAEAPLETKPRSPLRTQAPQLSPLPVLSPDLFSSKSEAHPFGAELAKVSELAEEFGAGEVQIVDEETQYLVDNGFRCFGATDYILEIQPLFSRAFGELALPVISEWI